MKPLMVNVKRMDGEVSHAGGVRSGIQAGKGVSW